MEASELANESARLPEVVVVGETIPTSLTSPSTSEAAEEKKDVPGGFTIKSSEQMQEGLTSSFQDLLQQTPGLFMQSENGTEVSRISVRGSGVLSEDEVVGLNIRLDGLNFTEADGETTLENLDVGTIKFAEVYRGASALKYGALMLGGAINLVPYTGYDADRFRLRLEGGSFGYLRGQVSSGDVVGKVDYFGSATGRYRDGFREHSREHTVLLFADAGYKINGTVENRVYFTFDQTSRQIPSAITKQQMQDDPRQAGPDAIAQDFGSDYYFLRLADKFSVKTETTEFNAGFFWYHTKLTERGFFDPDFREGNEDYHADNYGLALNATLRGELFGRRNILTLGFVPEYEDEFPRNLENISGMNGATTADGEGRHVNLPFYAENQHYLSEQLSLLTGAQFIYAQRRYVDRFTVDGDESHVQDFYGLNPKVGLIYEFNKTDQAYANLSRSFQPPALDNTLRFTEGSDSHAVYVPLNAQQVWTVEAGFRGDHDWYSWELSLYHSWLKNELLELNDAMGNDLGAANVPRSYHQGIEAGLEIELWDSVFAKEKKGAAGHRLTFAQTYTLTDCHFDDDPIYGDNRIAGIPVHLYQAGLKYEAPGGFYAGVNVQGNLSSYPADQANTLFADPYALLGFKIGYKWKKVLVFFEAKNLTDEHFPAAISTVADARTEPDPEIFHPGDGRAFYGGVSWTW